MTHAATSDLLEVLLDSWDRNNAILVHLLRLIPDEAMDDRAVEGSLTIGQMFWHMHYVRLLFVAEDAPEHARPVPTGGWATERDRARLERCLDDSAATMRQAVAGRLREGRGMDRRYDHPILLLQHFIWHEGYHHGQIKLALKAAGRPLDEEEAGCVTWDVWMDKGRWPHGFAPGGA